MKLKNAIADSPAKSALSKKWNDLPAKYRQYITYVVIGVPVAYFGFNYVAGGPSAEERAATRAAAAQPAVEVETFTDANVRDMGVEGLSARVGRLTRDNNELRGKLDRLTASLDKVDAKLNSVNQLDARVSALTKDLSQFTQSEIQALRTEFDAELSARVSEYAKKQLFTDVEAQGASPDPNLGVPVIVRSTEAPSAATTARGGAEAEASGEAPAEPAQIRTFKEDRKAQARRQGQETKAEKTAVRSRAREKGSFIPAGSIFSGVLLTGVDAPTGDSARREPHPMLIRLHSDTILPNQHRQDMSECHVLASGYGDIASARVLIRSSVMSCVGRNGQAYEVKVKANGIGEDGKYGLRGRPVDKQGELVRGAMIAGGLEAFAQVFRQDRVSAVATLPGADAQFQSLLTGGAAQTAATAGFGKSLDRLAEFYIDKLDQILPFLEVDAGRQIDFIVQEGFEIQT